MGEWKVQSTSEVLDILSYRYRLSEYRHCFIVLEDHLLRFLLELSFSFAMGYFSWELCFIRKALFLRIEFSE
jgi:hypothetical protein